MTLKRKKGFSTVLIVAGLLVLGDSFILAGCSSDPNKLNPAITGPQVIVNPDSIRLGVAKLTSMGIVFEGSGFQPNDSVFITLVGADKIEVVVADGRVKSDGTFKATVGPLAKVTGILRAGITGTYADDGKYNQILVITQAPISTGVYTARVTSMLSDQKAETKLTVSDPSKIDLLKDWLGKKMGKIQDKRAK